MSDGRLSNERGMKVAAGCSKHSSVTEELLIIDCHADICQLTTVVHWLHHLQNSRCESGVSVCRVCCSTARRALARPCWLALSPTTRSARSSVSQAPSSCRSLLAKDRAWSASCSSWLGLFSVLFTTRTTHTHTHTHPFNCPLSRTTRVSRYQKGKTNLDCTEARDSEWQWHELDHMQVCTSLQTDNHASTPPLSFLQAGCPSCHPTNSVKALKATDLFTVYLYELLLIPLTYN